METVLTAPFPVVRTTGSRTLVACILHDVDQPSVAFGRTDSTLPGRGPSLNAFLQTEMNLIIASFVCPDTVVRLLVEYPMI